MEKDFRNSTDRTPAGNTGLAKVAVQCSVSAEPRWLIKVWFSASIPKAFGMVKIATFAKPENDVCLESTSKETKKKNAVKYMSVIVCNR